ncbi:YgaP family membrane protein [Sutcliffiella cohnii]
MRPNIGIINALIRITCGFTVLAWVTSKLVKRPFRDSYLVVAFLAAMKIGEGILRYCPLTALYDRYLDDYDYEYDYEDDDFDVAVDYDTDEGEAYNPS